MSYEFYSAQTRQVKTAMVLSSATLLLYTIAGQPVNDFIKIPPGQFEIPADLLIYLFFLSAVYFSASFFVSANYDKKFSEMPELAKEIDSVIKSIRSWKNSVDSSVSGQFAEIRNYSRNMITKAHDINVEHLRNLGSRNQDTVLRDTAEFIKSLSVSDNDLEKRMQELEGYLIAVKSPTDEMISKLIKHHESLKTRTGGIALLHNHWWEYNLPLSASIFCILYCAFSIFIF